MKISVLVLTYNGEKYIEKQLLSILNQSLSVDEVIICDDHSTDGTIEIIRRFISNNGLDNWYLFVNKKNLGLSRNSEEQFKVISGDLIFLSDQDDIWEIDKVKVMTKHMENNQDVMLTSSMFSLINSEGDPMKKDIARLINKKEKENHLTNELKIETWLGYSSIPGCSICFRRNVLDLIIEVGRPELGISLGGDWYYGIISCFIGRTTRIHSKLFRRRVHSKNASLSRRLNKSTILSTTNEERCRMLIQAAEAHEYLLMNNVLQKKMTSAQRQKIKKMVYFIRRRERFTSTKNPFIWMLLLFQIRQYFNSSNDLKIAFRIWVTDFLYAYNINFSYK